MSEPQNHLGEAKISALMRRYAIPCIISLLVGALYSMPVSDLLTFAVAAYLIRGTYRELRA